LLVEDCYIPVCRRWIGFVLYETMFPQMLSKFVTVMNVINIWTSHLGTVIDLTAKLLQHYDGIIKKHKELEGGLHIKQLCRTVTSTRDCHGHVAIPISFYRAANAARRITPTPLFQLPTFLQL
jgi:hypothetical protein